MPALYFNEGLRQLMIYQNAFSALVPFALLAVLAVSFTHLGGRATK